jgi:hypothetical protein
MQLYAARERPGEPGVFDYTCVVDGCVFRTGYCAGWRDFNETEAIRLYGLADLPGLRKQHAAKVPFKDRYHTTGHRGCDEAEECYRQHLLDQHLVLHTTAMEAPKPCAVCWVPTVLWAEMPPGANQIFLCTDHHNRAGASLAFPEGSVREIMSSH